MGETLRTELIQNNGAAAGQTEYSIFTHHLGAKILSQGITGGYKSYLCPGSVKTNEELGIGGSKALRKETNKTWIKRTRD